MERKDAGNAVKEKRGTLLLDLWEEICGISFDSSRITIIARRISYYYDSMDKFCIFCQTAQISLNMMWYLDQPM
ncbi:hypothetical protein P8452_68550 [Trifolium repens]|nr:hypothetical protein P8452_68550 [Trifolium repens]